MTKYAIIDNGTVTNIATAFPEFAASQGWIDAAGAAIGDTWDGETFTTPAPPPPMAPEVVTMRQARLALLQSGHYATVVDYITNMTGDAGIKARISWEYSQTVERYTPLTVVLKGILGLTDAETDELYLLAASL
jgi:hypothetical protein